MLEQAADRTANMPVVIDHENATHGGLLVSDTLPNIQKMALRRQTGNGISGLDRQFVPANQYLRISEVIDRSVSPSQGIEPRPDLVRDQTGNPVRADRRRAAIADVRPLKPTACGRK